MFLSLLNDLEDTLIYYHRFYDFRNIQYLTIQFNKKKLRVKKYLKSQSGFRTRDFQMIVIQIKERYGVLRYRYF